VSGLPWDGWLLLGSEGWGNPEGKKVGACGLSAGLETAESVGELLRAGRDVSSGGLGQAAAEMELCRLR
jgi:hypothetical protein